MTLADGLGIFLAGVVVSYLLNRSLESRVAFLEKHLAEMSRSLLEMAKMHRTAAAALSSLQDAEIARLKKRVSETHARMDA